MTPTLRNGEEGRNRVCAQSAIVCHVQALVAKSTGVGAWESRREGMLGSWAGRRGRKTNWQGERGMLLGGQITEGKSNQKPKTTKLHGKSALQGNGPKPSGRPPPPVSSPPPSPMHAWPHATGQ
eukprot:3442489-Heterocapsa_arctica.AAC.1